MPHVLLLRAPAGASSDASNGSQKDDVRDPYEMALEPLKSSSVPVYETVQVLNELERVMEPGPSFQGYEGVVLTSKRSVDAWASASDALQIPFEKRASWSSIPFYVVGEATARSLRELGKKYEGTPRSALAPAEILGAEETGTGELLAHFILKRLAATRSVTTIPSHPPSSPQARLSHFSRNDDSAGAPPVPPAGNRRKTKLLFLVGDKTKDSLPTILGEDPNVELDPVQVYETKPSPKLSQTLQALMSQNRNEQEWWIAAFAPSGIDYALPHLEEHFEIPYFSHSNAEADSDRDPVAKPRASLAAIGPTTAAHMHEKGLEVTAVAAKPKPEELAKAIKAAWGKVIQ